MSERLSEDLEKELNSRNRFTKALRVIMYAGLVESLTELEQVIIYHSTIAGEMAALTMGSTLLLTKFIEYSKTEGKKIESILQGSEKRKNNDEYDEKPKRFELTYDGELLEDFIDEENSDLNLHNHR